MRLILAALLAAATAQAQASPGLLERLESHLEQATQGDMKFDQLVVSVEGEKTTSSGRLVYQRPARFRLEYDSPDRIEIVSDGETVWVHDLELNQVIVSDFTDVPGAQGLLAVLASASTGNRFVKSASVGSERGLDWLVLDPVAPEEVQFNRCEIGFSSGGTVVAVKFVDLLENVVNARFTEIEREDIDQSQFAFEIPDGAEVIQQTN